VLSSSPVLPRRLELLLLSSEPISFDELEPDERPLEEPMLP
jgi:hypothetical protein